MVTIPGADITPTINGSGGTLQTPSGDWCLLRHTITPRKLGGSITCQTTSKSCVCNGCSCRVVVTFGPSVQGIQTSLSSQLQGLSLGPLDGWGICLAVTMGQEGCNTFSLAGNLFEGLFSAVDSLAIPTVASSSGVLVGVDMVL